MDKFLVIAFNASGHRPTRLFYKAHELSAALHYKEKHDGECHVYDLGLRMRVA